MLEAGGNCALPPSARRILSDPRNVQPSPLQQLVSFRVKHGELAGKDQHPKHDHHRPANSDQHREVSLDYGKCIRHPLEGDGDQEKRDGQPGGIEGEQQGSVSG